MVIMNMIGGGKSGPKVPLNDISTLSAIAGDTEATIRRTDVGDLTVNGVLLNEWESTKLVRKIGSAPSDSSDGTLVLTETVADTYSSIGYTDTGLTNGTAYYYKAFSVGSNGLESGSNSVNVTPQQGGWHPGPNTLAYYTLNNNGTNQSTATTKFSDVILNTATYTTTKAHGANAYSLYCDGSTYAYVPASALHNFGTNDFTISCWVYSETNSGQYPGFISNVVAAYPNQGNGAYRISDRFDNGNEYNFCWDGYNFWTNATTGISIKDGWHNCVVTRINRIFYVYLDGNQVGTITTRTAYGCGVNGNIFLGYNLIDQLYSKCYLNDVIFESVGWSAQDASDYYQATA